MIAFVDFLDELGDRDQWVRTWRFCTNVSTVVVLERRELIEMRQAGRIGEWEARLTDKGRDWLVARNLD